MITQIKLKDCQSWDNITIDLAANRLNVLVAENDTGKSVLFKALKIVGSPKYYTREDRKDLIRFGCDMAVIGIAFDSGNAAIVFVMPNQVVYDYYVDGVKTRSLEPSPEMLKEVGLIVGRDGNFIANIIDADQDLMLVNSNLAGNFELIRMIVMNDDLDNFIERVNELSSEYTEYQTRIEDRKASLDFQLKDMKSYDILAMQHEMDVAEVEVDIMESLMNIWKCVESFEGYSTKDFKSLEAEYSILELLNEIRANTKDMLVPKEPVRKEFLEILEELVYLKNAIQLVGVNTTVTDPKYVDILESLYLIRESAKYISIRSINFGNIDKLCSTLQLLQELSTSVHLVNEVVPVVLKSFDECNSLEQKLLASGQEVECPLWGKVLFDGKECVANS